MTKAQIQALAGMDASTAASAFSRILAERPQERTALLRTFRADLPELYLKWLDQTAGRVAR